MATKYSIPTCPCIWGRNVCEDNVENNIDIYCMFPECIYKKAIKRKREVV